jgi:hypothetical protein
MGHGPLREVGLQHLPEGGIADIRRALTLLGRGPAWLRLTQAQATAVGAIARSPCGKAEAMHFSNDRVAGHFAELGGDLASAQSVSPELLELFDPIIVPDHTIFSPAQNRSKVPSCRHAMPHRP